MSQIATASVNVIEQYELRLHKIFDLVNAALAWTDCQEYYLPPGHKDMVMPACYVEDAGFVQEKHTSGKMLLKGKAFIYIRIGGNGRTTLRRELLAAAAAVFKLFTDNAAGDRTSNSPTYANMVLPGFWFFAIISRMESGDTRTFQRQDDEMYVREARLTLDFQDLLIP